MANIIAYLQKSFASFSSSIILPLNKIGYHLVQCAKANTYIETLGEHADALHLWIKGSYEEDFKKSFEQQVRNALKQIPTSFAKLAFDITEEPFYGKTSGLYIFGTKGKKYDSEFHFLTVCLIIRNKQIPLMALPLMVGEGSAKKTIALLEYCQTLFTRIRLAVFDRGFYIGELIDYLESKKIKYIIYVPERGDVIQSYVKQTEELGKFKHTLTYSKAKSKWKPKTMIIVCKGIDDFSWIFATNIHFKTRCEYIWHYKRRWQIETNFRVEDEGRIKSKSTSHLIRYFYFLASLLLHLLWIVNKNIHYYVPYKKYLDIVEHKLLFDYLGIHGIKLI
ncbi:MAG: transposase [archaeon]